MTIAVSDTLWLQVLGDIPKVYDKILTPEALGFLAFLELNFRGKRIESTPRSMKMRQKPLKFNFKGTFYAKKRLIGVDSGFQFF